MSVKLMAQVWEHSAEKGEGLLVLLALADFAHDDGLAYPSIEAIAAKAKCSLRGVQTIIKRLNANGWLEVIPGGGRNHTNLYIVRVPSKQASNHVSKQEASLETPQVAAETPQVDASETTETPHLVGSQMSKTPHLATGNPAFGGQPNAPDPSGSVRDPSTDPSGTSGATATTAREAAGAGEEASDPEGAGEAWTAVESLIGLVPPILEPSIDAAIARFGGSWVATACSRAAKANVRRWDYVSAILERWAVDGFDSPRPAPNGGRQRGTPGRTPGRRANLGAGPQPADRDPAGYAAWRSPEHDRIDELVRSGMPRYEAAEQARAERKAGAGMT